jgi:predicted dithiol-disulfide oxidoreductase (DUF899 family)
VGPLSIFAIAKRLVNVRSGRRPGETRGDLIVSNGEIPGTIKYPKIVSRAKWLNARKDLLAKEKELTRHRDAVNAERRRLPMVRIEKDYIFEGPAGKVRLLDLFEDRRQLIVYHQMEDRA